MSGWVFRVSVLAVTFALACLTVACGGNDGDSAPTPSARDAKTRQALLEVNSPLGYAGRTHLSVCIDDVLGYELDDEDVEQARAALSSALAKSPTTPPEEFEDWELVRGCPLEAPVSSLEEYQDNLYVRLTRGGPPLTDDPSPHFVFVYLLPSDVWYGDAAVTRNGWTYIPSSAETTCRMDLCWSLSHALFLPSDVNDENFQNALIARLGILANIVTPDPTFDREGCEQGTPEIPGCYEYLECRTPREDRNCEERLSDAGVGPGTPSP